MAVFSSRTNATKSFGMLTSSKTAGAFLKSLSHLHHCRLWTERLRKMTSRSRGPPWRLLFFGTDQFALESLRRLTSSRNSSDGIVETLEVVALPGDVPVKRFAQQNHLPVRTWPPENVEGHFDVGVVVSFGHLLPERLINKFPYGILNVHPSLLPRWRGPAPVFHTILRGDTLSGVTVIQILPDKFDIGPILNQELYQVPKHCTADELGDTLATKGAHLLIETLKTLPEKIADKREQGQIGATFAPKINTSMSWIVWEEQTCDDIDRLYRAIGSRIHLRTVWMGRTIKLLDFAGQCHISDQRTGPPGSVCYVQDSGTLAVSCKVHPSLISVNTMPRMRWVVERWAVEDGTTGGLTDDENVCQDGWVGFRAVLLKKRLTATDFYNGYLHHVFKKKAPSEAAEERFISGKGGIRNLQKRQNAAL